MSAVNFFQPNFKNMNETEPTTRSLLINTLETRAKMLDNFKKMLYEEYLLGFREICKDLHETNVFNKINMNDVVLIKKSRLFLATW